MLTHRAKLLLIGAVLTICLGATLLLEAPEATRGVDEVMDDPESLEGREIAIRGEVLDGSIDNQTMIFILFLHFICIYFTFISDFGRILHIFPHFFRIFRKSAKIPLSIPIAFYNS